MARTTHSLTTDQRVQRALVGLGRSQPFFAAILFGHTIRADDSVKTATIDGKSLRYNSDWIGKLSDAEVEGVLYHEAEHIAGKHHLRELTLADQELFKPDPLDAASLHACCNEAGDLEINGMIQKTHRLPKGALLPGQGQYAKHGDDWLLERHFDHVRKHHDGDGGQGEGDPGGSGEFAPPPGADTPEGRAEAERQWTKAVTTAAAATPPGKLPAHIREMLDRLLAAPEIGWKQKLRRFCTKNIKNRTSYSRPNRRMLWNDSIILPTKSGKTLARVALVQDSSGSISNEAYMKTPVELQGIMKAYPGASITMIEVDTEVASVQTFDAYHKPDFKRWERKAFGGTDMTPGFEEAKKHKPACIVCVTDGEFGGHWPPNPGIPVLWLMTTAEVPPYGERAQLHV